MFKIIFSNSLWRTWWTSTICSSRVWGYRMAPSKGFKVKKMSGHRYLFVSGDPEVEPTTVEGNPFLVKNQFHLILKTQKDLNNCGLLSQIMTHHICYLSPS